MGLLDALLSGLSSPSSGGGGRSDLTPLLQIAMQLLSSQGGQGGLSGLAEQFQRAGLGPQMNSWISTGQNMSISPDQLQQVFGQGSMQQMASGSGLSVDQVSGGLSDLLPQMIDRLTPHGQIPASGIDGALSELSRMMPRQ